jgi:hypothetical protein
VLEVTPEKPVVSYLLTAGYPRRRHPLQHGPLGRAALGRPRDVAGPSQVKLVLSPKQRAKPAASKTRTCTNAAVCIASGECPSRF